MVLHRTAFVTALRDTPLGCDRDFSGVLGKLDANMRPLFERINQAIQVHLESEGVVFVHQFGMAPTVQLSEV